MQNMKDFSFGIIPIIFEGGEYKFLTIRHLHEKGGHWAFPKGHMEDGETETETALRELKEETGIENPDIKGGNFFVEKYDFEQNGKKINKTVKYFLGFLDKKIDPVLQKEEIGDCRWVNFEDAMNLLTFGGSKKILEEVWNFLKK